MHRTPSRAQVPVPDKADGREYPSVAPSAPISRHKNCSRRGSSYFAFTWYVALKPGGASTRFMLILLRFSLVIGSGID